MATPEQLEAALRKADAAGNVDDARQLAAALRQMRGATQWQPKHRSLADLQAEAKPVDNTEGNSFLQNAAIGYGKSYVDTGRGLKQFGDLMLDKIAPRQRTVGDLVSGHDPSRVAEDSQDVARARRIDQSIGNTAGGVLGNVAGQAVQIATPVPAGAAVKATSWAGRAAPYVGAAARSGAFGAMQGTTGDESRLMTGAQDAVAGALGQKVAEVGGVLTRGLASKLEPAREALARTADAAGIKLGAGQLSQNPLVRTALSQMERLPFSGAGKRAEHNQQAFNELVGGTFGAPEKKITPDVFDAAKRRLSNTFETLSARNDLVPTTQLAGQMQQVLHDATKLGGSDAARMVQGWTNELLSKAGPNGVIPGKAYQSFDSRIGKIIKVGGEPAHYLGELRDAVRAAMDNSISPGDQAAWRAVRQQYAALKTVEPLVAKSEVGNIAPSQLMGRVTADKAGKSRMATGRGGSLGELARIGQSFMKDAPNSGTADRLLVNLGIGGGLFGAQHEGLISPETALTTGGLLLGNRAALKALNSRAVTMGEGKALTGLAKLLKAAPRALPALANTAGEITVSGGKVATPAEQAENERIVREFRRKQGR